MCGLSCERGCERRWSSASMANPKYVHWAWQYNTPRVRKTVVQCRPKHSSMGPADNTIKEFYLTSEEGKAGAHDRIAAVSVVGETLGMDPEPFRCELRWQNRRPQTPGTPKTQLAFSIFRRSGTSCPRPVISRPLGALRSGCEVRSTRWAHHRLGVWSSLCKIGSAESRGTLDLGQFESGQLNLGQSAFIRFSPKKILKTFWWIWANMFGHEFLSDLGHSGEPEGRVGGPKQAKSGSRRVGARRVGGPTFRVSFPSPAANFVHFFSLGGLLVELLPRFEAMDRLMCAVGHLWCHLVRALKVGLVAAEVS